MKRVAVLGAGRVGGVIARDLAEDPALSVLVVDRSEETLRSLPGSARVETRTADLTDRSRIAEVLSEMDVAVGAVPGAIGFEVLRTVVDTGKPVVDISFCSEDTLALDGVAKQRGVPVVVDCGVAPGLSNLLVGRSVAELQETSYVEILVGGLPFRRVWPYEYRAVFSPSDVIEEYTRPCRMRLNGREVVVPALSDPELVEFPQVGTLEAFNTDGLRSLLETTDAPTLKEKTLRYPGHAEKMRLLRDGGFFSLSPLDVGGMEVSPRALAEVLLTREWRLPEGEEEFTLLRVVVEGAGSGGRHRLTWTLFDRTDAATGTTSMARTTGFPCAIVTRMIADGSWAVPGVHPPEILGRDETVTGRILEELGRRGVEIRRSDERIS